MTRFLLRLREAWLRITASPGPAAPLMAIVLVAGLACASQAAFAHGAETRGLGMGLLAGLFLATGFFVAVERRSPRLSGTVDPEPIFSPPRRPGLDLLVGEPRQTYLMTLALIAITGSAVAAPDAENNVAAGVLWLSAVAAFLVVCVPSGARFDLDSFATRLQHHRIEIVVSGVVLAAGTFACLYGLDRYPIGVEQDEGQFGTEALRLMAGESVRLFGTVWIFDHTAVFTYLQAASMSLFGKDVGGLRVLSGLMGSASLVFVYALGRRLFGPTVALIGTSLFAFAPNHLLFSRLGIHDMVVMQLTIPAMLYFLHRGLSSHRAIDYASAGLVVGCGLWLDYNNKSIVLVPIAGAIFGYLALTRRLDLRSELPRIAIFLAAAVIVLVPLWHTLAETGLLWKDLARGKSLFAEPHYTATTARYGTTNLAIILAKQVERSFFSLNHFPDASFLWVMGQTRPILTNVTAVFFFIGFTYGLWKWREIRHAFLVLAFVVGLQMSIWSEGPPHAHRLTPILIPAYLFAAVGMAVLGRTWGRLLRWPNRALGAIAVVIIAGVTHENVRVFLSPESYFPNLREMTHTGRVIKALSEDHQVFYFGSPWHFARGHGSILFASERASIEAIDVADAHQVVPLREPAKRHLAFLFYPWNFNEIPEVRRHLPVGTLQEWRDEFTGEVFLQAYRVSKEDANAAFRAPTSAYPRADAQSPAESDAALPRARINSLPKTYRVSNTWSP